MRHRSLKILIAALGVAFTLTVTDAPVRMPGGDRVPARSAAPGDAESRRAAGQDSHLTSRGLPPLTLAGAHDIDHEC